MIGLWIVAGLCLVMALLLFCGKGGFIIIGYNTAPPQVKATFQKKKLYRSVGVLFLVLAAMTAATAVWYPTLHKVYSYAMVIAILACMFYCLGYCRTGENGGGQDGTRDR